MPSSSRIGYGLGRGLPAEEHEIDHARPVATTQLSVAAAAVAWEPLEAQPLNRSASTTAFPIAKQTILHQLPSFMASPRLALRCSRPSS